MQGISISATGVHSKDGPDSLPIPSRPLVLAGISEAEKRSEEKDSDEEPGRRMSLMPCDFRDDNRSVLCRPFDN